MKTGMPASFFLLSVESVMLRFEGVKVGSEGSGKVRFLSRHQEAILLKSLITLKGAACCSCLSPVRTFYLVKSDTERFGNVYSGPAVRTGRTVGPTWAVGLARP
jgi:hypothetical protein